MSNFKNLLIHVGDGNAWEPFKISIPQTTQRIIHPGVATDTVDIYDGYMVSTNILRMWVFTNMNCGFGVIYCFTRSFFEVPRKFRVENIDFTMLSLDYSETERHAKPIVVTTSENLYIRIIFEKRGIWNHMTWDKLLSTTVVNKEEKKKVLNQDKKKPIWIGDFKMATTNDNSTFSKWWEACYHTAMVLIGSAILPHGSMILDPTMEEIPPGVDELHTAAKYVGDYVRDHEPDIIVLATPHGINLSDSIGIYASRIGTGSAEWNDHWKEFIVSVNFQDDFAFDIFNHLQKKRINSNLIKPFGDRPSPLGWSEVVPLFFLSEQRGTTGTRKRICPYDVLAMSYTIFLRELIIQWIRSGSRTILLERALTLALETFPCAMSIFGILQGILDRSAFGGDIFSRKAPTYFGMIVALFHADEKGWKVLPRPFHKDVRT
ncbi:unnamed protein product [Lepeophtheirus salmonis]|uniref:(salmon louse) hypothetical protein n=1 Tax=Lepeophtheirus salmonis TaxID=72036 RepID=A0A7R8CQ54_LEPSM|nr:unnamed protein product [Lepeophtheirus salmonis]CAF2854528.1 unnamed protein product [Lepeophtheirus salmonis]